MIFRLFRPDTRGPIIAALYGAIVAQARSPEFYQLYGVPDTVNGRLEMVMLHVLLVLQRLQDEPPEMRDLGQGLFDHFCADMDASMREMGVGDLSVPRKMRRIGEAFYGRKRLYETALAAPDDRPLADALQRNVQVGAGKPFAAAALAHYLRTAAARLASQSREGLARGELIFPEPRELLVRA